MITQKIIPHIWLEKGALEAAEFYVSVFRNAKILNISYYPKASEEVSGQKAGSVMTVKFRIEGQDFMLLNGGSAFRPNEAISFMVYCDTQEEIDYYFERLSSVPEAEICGWLKDRFGVSWQIVPVILESMITDKDQERVERVTAAFLQMKKLDIRELQEAYRGK